LPTNQQTARLFSYAPMKTLLLLCTGNYYRSRYAEELFNHGAERIPLTWRAQSRGLAIERGINNVGPLSPFALEALKDRGLVAQAGERFSALRLISKPPATSWLFMKRSIVR
jgi:protein-tyrosine phosphatase